LAYLLPLQAISLSLTQFAVPCFLGTVQALARSHHGIIILAGLLDGLDLAGAFPARAIAAAVIVDDDVAAFSFLPILVAAFGFDLAIGSRDRQRVGRQRGRQAEGDDRQEEDAKAGQAPAWARYDPVDGLAQHWKGLPAETPAVHRVAEERFSPLRKGSC
jgi:hypothetical protein